MKLKHLILLIQRFGVVELEAILFILVIDQLFKWLTLSEFNIPGVIWLQLLFVLTAYPLHYFSSKKGIIIWLVSMSVLFVLTGYWLGVDAPWLPMALAIWRSISVADMAEDVMATYKRMTFVIVFLILYFIFSHLFQSPIWWAIPLLAAGSFGSTILGIACSNLLEQLSWQPNREEWKRIFRNQLVFVVAMMVVVVFLVVIRNKISFLARLVMTIFLKLVTIILAPIIILLSKAIAYFYSILEGNNKGIKGAQFNLSDALANAKVNDTTHNLNWIWITLLVIVSICFNVILVKMINNLMSKKKPEKVDWVEIFEYKDDNKRNPLLSFLKSVNPFGKRENINKIRLLYIDFLKQYRKSTKGRELPSNLTTRDMIKRVTKEFSVNPEELKQLTKVYEDNRYGGKTPDVSSIQKMKKAVENWLKA